MDGENISPGGHLKGGALALTGADLWCLQCFERAEYEPLYRSPLEAAPALVRLVKNGLLAFDDCKTGAANFRITLRGSYALLLLNATPPTPSLH